MRIILDSTRYPAWTRAVNRDGLFGSTSSRRSFPSGRQSVASPLLVTQLITDAFAVVRDGFGSAMVSNIGTFGLKHGFGPLVPMTRTPIVVLVGEVEDRPAVKDGQLTIRPMMTLGCTFDHRVIDGAHAGKIVAVMREVLADPESFHQERMHRPAEPPETSRSPNGPLAH